MNTVYLFLGIEGTIENIRSREYTVDTVVAEVRDQDGKSHALTMMQKWPVRKERHIKKNLLQMSL